MKKIKINMPISHGGSHRFDIPLDKLNQVKADIQAGKDLVIGNKTYKVDMKHIFIPSTNSLYRYSVTIEDAIKCIDEVLDQNNMHP